MRTTAPVTEPRPFIDLTEAERVPALTELRGRLQGLLRQTDRAIYETAGIVHGIHRAEAEGRQVDQITAGLLGPDRDVGQLLDTLDNLCHDSVVEVVDHRKAGRDVVADRILRLCSGIEDAVVDAGFEGVTVPDEETMAEELRQAASEDDPDREHDLRELR